MYNTRSQCEAKAKAKAYSPSQRFHCSVTDNKSKQVKSSHLKARGNLITTGTPPSVSKPTKQQLNSHTSPKKLLSSRKTTTKIASPKIVTKVDETSTSNKVSNNDELVGSLIKLNSDLINEVKVLTAELAVVKHQLSQSQKECEPPNVSIFSNDSSISEIMVCPNAKKMHFPPLVPLCPTPAISHLDISAPMLLDITFPAGVTSDTTPLQPPASSKPRVQIIGTSMSRDFASHLTTLLPEYEVSGFTYPSAKAFVMFEKLNSCRDQYGRDDFIILLAGTNDIPFLCPESLDKFLEKAVPVFYQKNVIICGVPYMYNRNDLFTNIFATNLHLQTKSSSYGYYYLDSNIFLARSDFTRHGLHFNQSGKINFCKKLEKLVLNLNQPPSSSFLRLKYSHPLFI